MKILFFISKLYGGGAERVASILLNHLCEKHNVTAAIFNNDGKQYPIDDRINILDLSKGTRIRPYQLNRIIKCRKAIKNVNPDLIISFLVGLNKFVVLANCFIRKKLILSEHNTMQVKLSAMEWSTQHLLYRFASMVTFISKSDYNYAKWLKNKTLIYNPLSYPISTTIHNNEKNIITIGPQKRWNAKGFDILIHAWAQIAPLHPDWKLQFVGTIDDNKISDMVKTLGLEKQVDFIGWTNEIDKILQTKSIYVLSSRREGFPCSLLEAMSQGCACLAFDCKTGPNEIITDGVSGILARNGDVDDLTAKLQLLIEDGPLRKRLGASATEEVRKFEKEKIMQQWDELIQLTVEQ